MQLWNNFAAKHPAAAKWVREGGLFVIVSNLVTVFKYLLLQFLPAAFSSLPVVDFGWPGIPVTLFGETFQWNILGYDSAHGGLPYFCAYMVAMVVGECINFPIQRLTGALIYLCSANDTADRQCLPAPPASLFLSLMLPRKGQPFPPERRNCGHTFQGVLQFRLPSAPQRYNTLDFPTENRVPRNRRFLWILPVKGEHYPL